MLGFTMTKHGRALLLALCIATVYLLASQRSSGDVAAASPQAQAFAPVVLSPPDPPSGCVPYATIPADDRAVEQLVLKRLNEQRSARGLPPLAQAAELTQSARRHSNDMADNGFTGHTGSDGSNVGRRVNEACYDWVRVGEIIGWGFTNAESMVSWWMNSPPHRALILSTALEDFGAGYVDQRPSSYRYYWTVNFGRRALVGTAGSALPYTCAYQEGDETQGTVLIIRSARPCPRSAEPLD